MSCLLPFIASITLQGVNPPAYARFVNYTVENLLPTDNDLARDATYLFSGLAGATILSVVIIVFITLVIIMVALVASDMMTVSTAIGLIAFVAACLALYFAIGYTYSKKVASDVALSLQQNVRTSAILIINSIVRDAIYLSLCE